MRQSNGKPNGARKTELRHLQESNEALLKLANAMAASLEGAQKAASRTHNAATGGSTGKPVIKTKK